MIINRKIKRMKRIIVLLSLTVFLVTVLAQSIKGMSSKNLRKGGFCPINIETYQDVYTRSEMENCFIKGILTIQVKERKRPEVSEGDLKQLNDDILYLPDSAYIIPNVSRNSYLKKDENNELQFVFSDVYPFATMANYIVIGNSKDSVRVNLSVLRHEYGEKDTLIVSLESLIQYAMLEGCVPYWGVSSYERDFLKGTLFLYNEREGYDHVIRLECQTKDIGKSHNMLQGQASLFIPTNNVDNLFEE